MIKYPFLEKGETIGVTAPSSGVKAELHHMFKQACESMERKGYKVVCGETVWTQEKAKSAGTKKRANEFIEMIQNENIDIIIPPWGGELLIEILEEIDFETIIL
jgi:muramoyltetrapeptide carboxypeptidase LdcA involved in peptidoglycan recycling